MGLLRVLGEVSSKAIVDGNKLFEEFKGVLTEQYVLQELLNLKGIRSVYYWSSSSTAEVDFVFANDQIIVPVEVKAGENLNSKSLKVYREKYNPQLVIRTSLSNLRNDNGLLNIPLYAFWNAQKFIDEAY